MQTTKYQFFSASSRKQEENHQIQGRYENPLLK